MNAMKLINYRTNGHIYLLTFREEPSWWDRLRAWLKKKKLEPRTLEYSGHNAIWHTYPERERCNVMLSGELTSVYKRIKIREAHLRSRQERVHG